MSTDRVIRWGLIGAANIARSQFLPALRATGDGVAYAVAGRDLARTREYAQANGVERAIEGYSSLLADDAVDAVYIALPNSFHAEWTMAALRAEKAVLCEKPLCASVEQTVQVLEAARESPGPLWEAFVFPFHRQMARLHELLEDGVIGELREIHSDFHFPMRRRPNIRLSPELAGGALNDVGCYSIRLAQLLFGAAPDRGVAVANWAPEGVDEEMQAILAYSGERRLVLSCGFLCPYDTLARLLGDAGEIRLSNPFHPTAEDTIDVILPDRSAAETPTGSEPSFTAAIRHIHAVLRGEEAPRYTAEDDSLATELALDMLHRSAQSGQEESFEG